MTLALYFFRVLVARQRVLRGFVSAPTETEAREQIATRHADALLLSLRRLPAPLAALLRNVMPLNLNLPPKALAPLLRQLALLLKAGVPVEECLANLIDDARDAKDKAAMAVLERLRTDMRSGLQLSACLERQPDTFPETVRCLAAVGDQTGLIGEALIDAADNLDKSLKMKGSIRQALIYPFFTFGAMFAAAAFWITYVIPNMAGLFKQMNAKLPAITVATMAGAEWITENGLWLALAVGAVLGIHLVLWRQRLGYRVRIFRILGKTPIVRRLVEASSMGVIFESLRVLYGSGIDLIRSLDITSQSILNDWHRQQFDTVRQRVAHGFNFTESARGSGLFSRMSLTIISAGERSGTLDAQFSYLSRHYAELLDNLVKNLAEIIKPLIVIVAGGFFIFMIVALLLPIYDLVKQTMAASYR